MGRLGKGADRDFFSHCSCFLFDFISWLSLLTIPTTPRDFHTSHTHINNTPHTTTLTHIRPETKARNDYMGLMKPDGMGWMRK